MAFMLAFSLIRDCHCPPGPGAGGEGGPPAPGPEPGAMGRGPDNPMPGELLRAKFENCARRALSADRVARLYGAFEDFENLRAIGDLTAIIAAPVAAAQPAAE